ncbi:hypothetical protein [Archaeoglobus sp.]
MVRFRFFVEDEYGDEFFRKLVNRLKEEGLIPREIVIDAKKLPADCNKKIDRVLNASLKFGNFDKAVLIIDGDGNPKKKRESAESHIPFDLKDRVYVIVFEYEAEEWICKSLGVKCGNVKPSKALNDWLKTKKGKEYHKRDLPRFVSELDFKKLSNDPNYKLFLRILK